MTKKYIFATLLVASLVIWVFGRPSASEPEVLPTPTPIVCVDDIQCFAVDYGISEVEFRETIRCESNFRHDGLFGDGGDAYGVAQYHFSTFYSFRKKAVEQGYPFENFQYENREDQLELTAWAFLQGVAYKKHWTCWSKQFAR